MHERLTAWLRTQLPDADDVRVEGLDRVNFGHSAEMMVLTVVARRGGQDTRRDVVLRLRPKPPALLEPYDLARQFDILRALERTTAVRVPRGAVARGHRRRARPAVLRHGTRRRRRLRNGGTRRRAPTKPWCGCARAWPSRLAAIHSVDLDADRVCDALDDGSDHLDRELDHWAARDAPGQARSAACPRTTAAGAARQQARAVPDASPWCTATPSRATSPSSAARSARCSTGR